MTRYAVLPRAAANRVYGSSAMDLAAAELAFVDQRALGGVVEKHETMTLGGIDYLVLDCGSASLDADAVAVLSNLSGLHALFELVDLEAGPALVPVDVRPRTEYDDDITTIQRYVGKTNEQFTKLLVNVTLAAVQRGFHRLAAGETVRLLDPLCGRGTTLNQAVVYGIDAQGIEIDRRDCEAYDQFVTTWLKDKRVKHKAERARLRKGRETPAARLTIAYGPPDARHHLELVGDDTLLAAEHIRARSIDLVVADLPYGVQHETRPDGSGRMARRPDQLLKRALPVWRGLIRGGGAIGLSWNLRTLDRPAMVDLLESAGYVPSMAPDDTSFVHRVDRAITRDLVVATPAKR